MNFFDRFRVVAAGFLDYAGNRDAESPAFDDCPAYCDAEGRPRPDYCRACPIGELRNQFREDAERELAEMPGSQFGFDYLHSCVINALAVEGLPRSEQTIKTVRMLAILDGERARIRRVRKWNEQQKEKQTSGFG